MVNLVLTAVHVGFILFVIVMGFRHGDRRNLTRPADPSRNPGGFFPHGAAGVFDGAAAVYLSYIGYDAVSTMAEEVERPVRDIPAGVSGSVIVVTALYCLMAASMSMLLPYDAVRRSLALCSDDFLTANVTGHFKMPVIIGCCKLISAQKSSNLISIETCQSMHKDDSWNMLSEWL
jgi:amino acid transporter